MNKDEIKHIIPAILPRDYQQLQDDMSLVSSIVKWVQIDIVDGNLAPNRTWPFVGDPENNFKKMVRQEMGMPNWEELEFEIDLMVKDPSFMIDEWIAVGASRIIVHKKGLSNDKVVELAKNVKDKGVEFMLAFEYEEGLEIAREILVDLINLDLIDGVQCMGIEHIGFQHQPFSPKVLNFIKSIKTEFPILSISVDGGVNLDNARALIDMGADRLVSGSLIFTSDMPRDTIEHLEEICVGVQL